MESSIPENLALVRKRIDAYEKKYARPQGTVRLLAVSKTHPVGALLAAHAAGQHDFAENYLQEALDKMQQLEACALNWHYIGPVQSNKTRELAAHFDWIHTVERAKIAQRLNSQRPLQRGPLNVLLQVNISNESSKAGVSLQELPVLAAAVATLPNLKLRGLMAIPAPEADFTRQRAAFRLLAAASKSLQQLGYTDCTELSMGMSQDFEAAIAEGATMVRIGSDIFGSRSLPQNKLL